jgi:hypothetical protein
MRRTNIIGLALVVALVMGATASTASARRLTLSGEGAAVALGDELILDGRENLAVYSSDGYLSECRTPWYEEMEVRAALDSISGKKDIARLTEDEGRRNETQIGPCESDGGNALVFWRAGGQRLTLGANGKATLRPVSIGVSFESFYGDEGNHERDEQNCSYFTKALSGKNTATPTRQPLTVEFNGTLKLHASPKVCPKTLHVSLSFSRAEVWGEIIGEAILDEEI